MSQIEEQSNRDVEAIQAAEAAEGGSALAELPAKVASLEDALLRAKADAQNVQRRAAMERQEGIKYANAELMKSLLNVLDDLERTLKAADEGADAGFCHAQFL